MLYMVIEKFKPGRKTEVYNRYTEKGRMLPAGLRYVSSWVEVDGNRCFQVMTTMDDTLLEVWMRQWDDLVDFEVVAIQTSPVAD